MPDVPFVFISSTTRDLEEERKQVAHWVNQHGCHAVLQNIFAGEPDTTTIPALLDKHLKPCAAVIHLCGFYFGSGPKDASPPVSYTRMEYEYGKEKGLPVMVLLADEAKYLPLCPDQTDKNAELQRGYYDGFRNSSGLYYPFKEIRELEGTVTSFLKKHGIGTETSTPPHNLPFASIGHQFVGRDEMMEELTRTLEKGPGAAALTSVAAVHALGGLGKTRVAIEHAWHSRERYTALLFVKAASAHLSAGGSTPAVAVDPLMGPLAFLSNVLKLSIEATEEAAHYRAVMNWFQQHQNWLLIIDNVDTKEAQAAVNALLPHLTNGHVLITSRLSTWSGPVKPLEIGTLSDADGAALILRAIGQRGGFHDTEAAATAISQELGGHALALQQAAAYIRRNRMPVERYLEKWRTQRDELLKRTELPADYPLTVSATLEITFAELSPGARVLLDALSFFASDPIPRYVVESIELPDGAEAGECLLELFDWHMAECGENGDTVTIHGLVQVLIRSKLEAAESQKPPLEEASATLHAISINLNPRDAKDWPKLDQLVPHLIALENHAERLEKSPIGGQFLNRAGHLAHAKAQYGEAEQLFRAALEAGVRSYGKNHLHVSNALSSLALMLSHTSRFQEAEKLYRDAIKIDENYFDNDNLHSCIALGNLAGLLVTTNRSHEAEPLIRRVLDIEEHLLGRDHPNIAIRLNNLARLLHDTNRLQEAEPLLRRAIEIQETFYGMDHPFVAIRLNNLAGLFIDTNRFQEAEALLLRALEIDERILGKNHPNVAIRLNNLGGLLIRENRLHDVEPLLRRALAIDEATVGPDHPSVARVVNNLANLFANTNRHDEAEQLYRRALKIDENTFGQDHPAVSVDLDNLASLLQGMVVS